MVITMTKFIPEYSLGDIVVHRYYGIGKIDSVERKMMNRAEAEYFKVKTENAVYWFPKDSAENPCIHPVASQEIIKRVIEILRSAPQDLDNDPRQWRERIDDVKTDGDILVISSLIRDLTALKTKEKLNQIQSQALNDLEDQLISEWAASLGVDPKSIRIKLKAYLKESQ